MGKFVDLTGMRFGRWEVEELSDQRDKYGRIKWRCRCDCGNIRYITTNRLKSGKSQSCGCLAAELTSKNKTLDLTGQKFERLTVIRRNGSTKTGQAMWECKCDCGNIVTVTSRSLISGNTKSCGCYNIECIKNRSITHGMRNSRIYYIWRNMKARCLNKTHKQYKDYGGRGITVCEEWHDFIPFYNWSMQEGYSDELSIDRINNDAGYSPENCRWTNKLTQANNTRRTIIVTYNGESMPLAVLCRKFGFDYRLAVGRHCRGWPDEDLFIPKFEPGLFRPGAKQIKKGA